jgi:hypothetical protein
MDTATTATADTATPAATSISNGSSSSSSSSIPTKAIPLAFSSLDGLSREVVILPKGLPDVDDVSMTHVARYIEHYREDVFWSYLSDSFFVLGGLAYVMLSVYDYAMQQEEEDDNNNNNNTLFFKILEWLAPMVYLFNSVVDVLWASKVQERFKLKRAMSGNWSDWRIMNDDDDDNYDDHNYDVENENGHVVVELSTIPTSRSPTRTTTTTITTPSTTSMILGSSSPSVSLSDPLAGSPREPLAPSSDEALVTTSPTSLTILPKLPQQQPQPSSSSSSSSCRSIPWYTKWRKHAAHRRTYLAAVTFGLAAFFAVLSVDWYYFPVVLHPSSSSSTSTTTTTTTGDESTTARMIIPMDEIANFLSVHLYILNATIAISGKRTRPWFSNAATLHNPETLEDLGDLLFLVGSCVDGILLDGKLDDGHPEWSIFSSLLWMLDACLYLQSDRIMAAQLAEQRVPTGVSAGILI